MTSPVRALAVAALLAAAGLAFFACGERGDGPGKAPPAPAATDTGATARAAFAAFFRPNPDRIPHELATNPGTPWGDYVGSKACKPCHEKAYAGWRDSFHSRTLYDVVPGTVFGDFSGRAGTYDDPRYNLSVRPFTKDGRYFMEIRERRVGARKSDWLPVVEEGTFEVVYAFGNRRHQPYVARAADGRYVVLPVFWDDVQHAFDWDGWRPYVQGCAHCHVTGIKSTDERTGNGLPLTPTRPQRYSPPSTAEGWSEGAIGCEVCHGPGRAHVEKATAMGDAGYRAYLREGGASTIYDPSKDTRERRMQQCDTCHNFFSESQVTWVPGPGGYPHDPYTHPLTPADDPKQFHENGTDLSPCTVGRVFRASKMGRAAIECRDCHSVHGNSNWAELTESIDDNRLCLKCHELDKSGAFKDKAAVARHAHHDPAGPGVLCVECHMPRDKHFSNGVVIMAAELHSHAMSIPTGYENERGGPASACNSCHRDRDALWTRKTLEAWHRGEPGPR